VVQTAAKIVLEPIFEVDFEDNQRRRHAASWRTSAMVTDRIAVPYVQKRISASGRSRYKRRMEGKYSVELFRDGGEGAGVEKVLARYENLAIARAFFRTTAKERPGRLIMLRERAGVVARSDGTETVPR